MVPEILGQPHPLCSNQVGKPKTCQKTSLPDLYSHKAISVVMGTASKCSINVSCLTIYYCSITIRNHHQNLLLLMFKKKKTKTLIKYTDAVLGFQWFIAVKKKSQWLKTTTFILLMNLQCGQGLGGDSLSQSTWYQLSETGRPEVRMIWWCHSSLVRALGSPSQKCWGS
jgi:hypothetical protein